MVKQLGLYRLRIKASERGAAIFVVIMVLTILTAIGVFASRAAGLNQRLSGYSRQDTQTGYVAEYGTLFVMDEVSGPSGQAYIQLMKAGTEVCRSNQFVDADGGVLPCYRITKSEMQDKLNAEGNSALIIDPDGGSLGRFEHNLTADFNVEMTDLYKGPPAAGSDQSGIVSEFGYMQMTLTGSGQVRPVSTSNPDAGICTTPEERGSAQMSGTRSVRAVIETRVQAN